MDKHTQAIVSEKGEIHGRGSDPYKWVSHLTADERSAVRAGHPVLIRDHNRHPKCAGWKRVWHRGGRYYHRELVASDYADPRILAATAEE